MSVRARIAQGDGHGCWSSPREPGNSEEFLRALFLERALEAQAGRSERLYFLVLVLLQEHHERVRFSKGGNLTVRAVLRFHFNATLLELQLKPVCAQHVPTLEPHSLK